MRNMRCLSIAAAAILGVMAGNPAGAQRRPSVAIMPSQYFEANAESAQNFTAGLTQQFESHGYTVVPADQSASAFQSLNLEPSRHYADSEAIRFGRAAKADLVVYPRLLAMGIPAATSEKGGLLEPAAVVLVRVVNVHSRAALYCRQVGHAFGADVDATQGQNFVVPAPVATATAQEVTDNYFQRISNSRGELRGMR